MMNFALYHKWHYLKQKVAYNFKTHKALYIIGLLCFLLGFTTGIMSAVKYAELVTFSDISDTVLLKFLTKDASVFSVFFSHFINYVFLGIVIFFVHSTLFLVPLGYIILIYKSFISALTLSFFIILCGFGGVLLTAIILLPFCLLANLALLIVIVNCTAKSYRCRRYGGGYYNNNAPEFLMNILIWSFILLVIACLIELLFLPIISATIIIII